MKLQWKRGQAAIAILCVMVLLVTAACADGDDEDDGDTESAATATVTTAAAAADTSPTPEADDEPTETATDEEDEDVATSTSRTGPTTEATATDEVEDPTATTSAGEPTATEANGATTPETSASPELDDQLGDFNTLDPELLPNFSLRMDFVATNLSGTPETTVRMVMEQSEVGTYHLDMETDGEMLEFWTIGEQSWVSIDGEVTESPTGPLFSPSDILTTGELIPAGLDARNEGTEEVNGREATRWVIDGDDYVAYMNTEETNTVEMSDGSGEVVVWIDNELNIMLMAEGDVAWTNDDGTEGSLVYNYEIYDIGSTAEIEAPQ